MLLTFCCWTKSLHTYQNSLVWNVFWGFATGLAYFNMVAAWGGYVFVLNLLGVHATFLVLIGRYSRKLYVAYTSFYILGTFLAIRVPVVGWTPLKSLEQLGPAVVFFGMQLIMISDYLIARRRTTHELERWKIRVMVGLAALCFVVPTVFFLAPTGYFGPISSRVRGLFVEHTKTGNPLVDSVAEHQPASTQAYFQYLNVVCFLAPVGLGIVMLFGWNDSSSFLFVYGVTAYFFSHRMVRLILLTAPIASVCGGIFLGHVASWILGSITTYRVSLWDELLGYGSSTTAEGVVPSRAYRADPIWVRVVRLLASAYLIKEAVPRAKSFSELAHEMAHHISHPSIIVKARTNDGEMVIVDDYREAYWWLRDNTDEDARVVSEGVHAFVGYSRFRPFCTSSSQYIRLKLASNHMFTLHTYVCNG
jgi:dolichyl-diphosphooligosaccharide--protein glycosyltransferase